MKPLFVRIPAFCGVLLLNVAFVSLQANAADTCQATATQHPAAATAQAFLDALRETNQVPGMAAAVWHKGKLAWTGCSGWRDLAAKRPVQRDSVFRLASVSKVIAATAVAKLAEQGKVDLDAPVKTMLPWLRNDWAPITLRQLAAHVSGLPHYALGDADVGLQHYADARAAVRIFADRALLSPPGQRYTYSSWGYTLIGAVIEAQTGKHVLDYLGDIVPGLEIAADGSFPNARTSRLYALRKDGRAVSVPAQDFSYTWTGGGLAATPEALVRFGARVMDAQIISAKTWQAMRQPLPLTNSGFAGERDFQVGLGWRVGLDADGANIAHHAGATVGSRSSLVLWPAEGTAATVLSNAEWISSIDKTTMLLAAPFRTPPTQLHARSCPIAARSYSGQLGTKAILGKLRFTLENGRCIGILEADSIIRQHFANASAWPEHRLRIVGFSTDGSLARAALATPFGLYELRATADGHLSAALTPEQILMLKPMLPAAVARTE